MTVKLKNLCFMANPYELVRMSTVMVLIGVSTLRHIIAEASDRSSALANDFMFFCMRGKASFDGLIATPPRSSCPSKRIYRATWGRETVFGRAPGASEIALGDTSLLAEAVNSAGTVETCGIGSADGIGDEIHAELTAHSNLGVSQESISPDGRIKMVTWTMLSGGRVVLTRAMIGPGLYLTLVDKTVQSK
jgi:hypothetical protein